jgi:hypothetical protein
VETLLEASRFCPVHPGTHYLHYYMYQCVHEYLANKVDHTRWLFSIFFWPAKADLKSLPIRKRSYVVRKVCNHIDACVNQHLSITVITKTMHSLHHDMIVAKLVVTLCGGPGESIVDHRLAYLEDVPNDPASRCAGLVPGSQNRL